MERISIKLDIAGVVIPMTIYTKDEEEIRKLAKKINEKAGHVRSLYSVSDVSTLLAMVTLQMAIDAKGQSSDFSPALAEELQVIHKALSQLVDEK